MDVGAQSISEQSVAEHKVPSQVPKLDHERSLLLPAVFASCPTLHITNAADGKLMLLN